MDNSSGVTEQICNTSDSPVSQAVGQRVDGPLPSLGGEEDGRLRHLASTAWVGGEALGYQVLPSHPKVHRVLHVHLVVGMTLWHAAAHCNLKTGVTSAGHTQTADGQTELTAVYLELHDPALVWNYVVRDGVDLPAVSVAAHHHSIRGVAETLHGAVLGEQPVVAH